MLTSSNNILFLQIFGYPLLPIVCLLAALAILVVVWRRPRLGTAQTNDQFANALPKTSVDDIGDAIEKETRYGLIESMREGIQVLAPDWSYLFLNDAVVKQSHFSREELMSSSLVERYPGIEQTPFFKVLERCMEQREPTIMENEFTYPDGAVRWFELSIQPVPEGVLILSIDVTERKEAERKVAEHQQMLARAILQAQEKERNQLGLELHDNINQILATVKMYVEVLKTSPQDWQQLVERSAHYLNLAINETRQLSHTLVAPSLGELSLSEVLGTLAQTSKATHGPSVEFIDKTPPGLHLERDKALMLYRIAQEQLQNIVKHAGASKAWMVLSASAREIALSIADDGVGFVPSAKSEGIGLRNIRSRVEWLAGKMSLEAAPAKGCTLEIVLPIS